MDVGAGFDRFGRLLLQAQPVKRIFCLLLLTQWALAHNFWLKLEGQRAILYYGHGSDEMQYAKEVVKRVSGLTSGGKPAKVTWKLEGKHAVLLGQGDVAQMGVEVDEGFWTKSTEGWKNKSKREVANALAAEWSLSYSKVLLKPSACLNRRLDHKLEIVPLALEAKSLRLRVVLDGQPLSKVALSDGHEKSAETDSAGEATVAYQTAVVYSVQTKQPLVNSPDADTYKLRAVLSLPAR